jgi:cupin 2 domain-containing protein
MGDDLGVHEGLKKRRQTGTLLIGQDIAAVPLMGTALGATSWEGALNMDKAKTDGSNLFARVPEATPEEFVQVLVCTGGVKIERIVSRGHCSPPDFWYDQETCEFVTILKGSAGIRFRDTDEVLSLNPGDWLNIPAHVQHQLAWTDPLTDTVWLTVHYPADGRERNPPAAT